MTEKIDKKQKIEMKLTFVKIEIERFTQKNKDIKRIVFTTQKFPRITWAPKKEQTMTETCDGYETKIKTKRALRLDELPKEFKELYEAVQAREVKIKETLSFTHWETMNDEEEVVDYCFFQGENPFEGIKVPKEEKV